MFMDILSGPRPLEYSLYANLTALLDAVAPVMDDINPEFLSEAARIRYDALRAIYANTSQYICTLRIAKADASYKASKNNSPEVCNV